MTTCPECGQQANDDAKFCDRCGQGLARLDASRPQPLVTPLAPGTELKGRFRIVAVLSQSSDENRYRAERIDAASGPVLLRERLGPALQFAIEGYAPQGASTEESAAEENPSGPRAKTADLKLKRPPVITESRDSDMADVPRVATGEPGDRSAKETATLEESRPEHEVTPGGSQAPGEAAFWPEPQGEFVSRAKEESTDNNVGEDNSSAGSDRSQSPVLLSDAVPNEPECVDEATLTESGAEDLGEVFGRVLALSATFKHPAFHRAIDGFQNDGRVYLVYDDEEVSPLAACSGDLKMSESEALNVAIQLCQAVAFVHRRGLRVNDICPDSVAYDRGGRIKLTSLDYISNDNELQSEPIFNDGYTAPEIYHAKKVDKRADVFSIGAVLYSCVTGERLDSESWREEAGPIAFYPPHVVTPALEQVVRRALLFDPAARWSGVEALKAELLKLASVIRIRSAVMTDVGMVRELNEDAVMAVDYIRESLIEPSQSFLYVVADGMGGAAAGEIASAIAVGAIRNYVEGRLAQGAYDDLPGIMRDALEDANRKILDYQSAHAEARGMGSTAVSALIIPPNAALAWVGDSRAYLCENGELRQLSKDHSLVQRLIEIGQITPAEARRHEHKNVITRSLGARQSGLAGAESSALRLKRGDRLMLCSDGLTTHVEDAQIRDILRRHSEPDEAARELVVAANAGGGTDNVSVVVIYAS